MQNGNRRLRQITKAARGNQQLSRKECTDVAGNPTAWQNVENNMVKLLEKSVAE